MPLLCLYLGINLITFLIMIFNIWFSDFWDDWLWYPCFHKILGRQYAPPKTKRAINLGLTVMFLPAVILHYIVSIIFISVVGFIYLIDCKIRRHWDQDV